MSSEENKPNVDENEVKEENNTSKEDEPTKPAEVTEEKSEPKEEASADEKSGDKTATTTDDATDDGDADEETEGDEEVKKPAKKRPVKSDDGDEEEEEDKETEEDGEDEGTEEDEKKNGIPAKKGKKADKEKKDEIIIPEGKGTPLKECPRIEHFINLKEPSQLKKLHQTLYGKVGKVDALKDNIFLFKGFDYEPESDAYANKKTQVSKLDFKHLKDICDILDLEKKGKKDDLVTRIMDFLMEPKDSGKPLPVAPPPRPKRTSAVKANNRGYAGQDSDDDDDGGRRGRAAGRRTAKGRPIYKDETSSDEDKPKRGAKKYSDESDAEESDPDMTPSDSDSDSPKKKKKAAPVKRGRGAPRKTPAKTPKRGAPKRGKKKAVSESDEKSESEDEPLQKKPKKFPSDEEIKKIVRQILENANLEEITMKTVCKQVYSKYPEHDLTHKKDLIKTTVKSIIST